MSSCEKPRRKLLMVLAGPSIGTEIRERIVKDVSEPRILHSSEIRLPSKMFTMMLETRNTYFEVCRSFAFLDNLVKIFEGSI